MKRVIWSSLFCLLTQNGYCQVVAMQQHKRCIFYECIDNPITIAVENTPYISIIVTTDNGKIVKNKDFPKGLYMVHPLHIGTGKIIVKKKTKTGLKTIGEQEFMVKGWPYFLNLDGKNGGEITKTLLCEQIAPSAIVENIEIDARIPFKSFTVVILRNNEGIFRRILSDKNGTRIDSTTNDFFTSLQNNDRVLFKDIAMNYCDGTPRPLDSMEFIVTEAEKYKKWVQGDSVIIVDSVTGQEVIKHITFPK